MIDLHTHTTKSDGTLTPTELIEYAKEKGISHIAVTDHDSIEGLEEAMMAGRRLGVDVIPGIEFSTAYHVEGENQISHEHGKMADRDIHVVGLFIEYDSQEFKKYLEEFVDTRQSRNEKMCARLAEYYGFDISFNQVQEAFPEAVITRAHFAAFLQEKGYVKSKKEAFERYIGDHCPCFVPREKISPVDAVKIIHRAKGLAILAHPVLYGLGKSTLKHLVSQMKDAGLDGIEAVYSTYSPSDERDIKSLAKEMGLLISGGSDFHGENKPDIDLGIGKGRLYVDDSLYENLKKRKDEQYK